MRKSKPCPVCKKDYPNVTYHIRKLAMNDAFEKEFIPKKPVPHLNYLKKNFVVYTQDSPYILVKNNEVSIKP